MVHQQLLRAPRLDQRAAQGQGVAHLGERLLDRLLVLRGGDVAVDLRRLEVGLEGPAGKERGDDLRRERPRPRAGAQ